MISQKQQVLDRFETAKKVLGNVEILDVKTYREAGGINLEVYIKHPKRGLKYIQYEGCNSRNNSKLEKLRKEMKAQFVHYYQDGPNVRTQMVGDDGRTIYRPTKVSTIDICHMEVEK